MSGEGDLAWWISLLIAGLILFGALLVLIGAIGLLRLGSFYQRVHAPTLGTSMGAFSTLLGSIIYFSMVAGRPVFHEILIGVFITMTTPIAFMMLVRAALYRDRSEKKTD